MKVVFLSSQNYEDRTRNNGDCILVDTGVELVVYDCGCEEHAKRVEKYMKNNGYGKVKIVLSHNDADHFDGIPYLVDRGCVSEVFTLLLLKYKDELLELINDKRRNRDSIAKSIEEIFDNIYSLSDKVKLKDIFADIYVTDGLTIIGPDKDYALNAVAKRIDSRESDQIDKETIVNAVSTQLSVSFDNKKKLLLTGDSSYESLESNLERHSAIQLPHHGKKEQADQIFNEKDNNTIYYVSDNTGDSNGGSDKLPKCGRVIYNTLNGDQTCTADSFLVTVPRGSYFRNIIL